MNDERYYFWRAPVHGLPEFTSGGHGISVIPGLEQFVLIHATVRKVPPDAIPARKVVSFLHAQRRRIFGPSTLFSGAACLSG